MKKICFALAMAFSGATASAEDGDSCAIYVEAAELAMNMRQLGVPMSDIPLLKRTNPDNPGPDLLQTIFISAYDLPQYQTEVQRHAAVVKYRDEVHAHCLDDWK